MTPLTPHTVDGGGAVALALEALGVETVFTIPSAHTLSILKAIHQRGRIRVVGGRHEQGVLHAADAYARTTGRLGVAVASTGPGTANTMGGLYEAHHASSPVLLITSQVPTHHLGRGRAYVHEAEQQAAMLRTQCREVVTATDADSLAETVVRLGRSALSGRPRPVAIEIPTDVQDEYETVVDLEALTASASRLLPRRAPSADAVAQAADVLAAACRPVIWAGGGVVRSEGAPEALRALARRWQAPVITSREGRGAIGEHDPLSLNANAIDSDMPAYLASCDVMLAVGTRFQQYPTAEWSLRLPERLVHLDVDPTVIGRSYPAELALVGDAAEGLRALHAALPSPDTDVALERKRHVEQGRQTVERTHALVAERVGPDHAAICESIKRHRPRRGVVVRDATVPAYAWGETLLPIHHTRTSIRSTAAGIGPGLPLAIGAALGSDEPVVVLQGDGGFMLSVGELATAVQHQLPIVICLFNDSGYQMLRNIEGRRGDGMLHDVDLSAPDFTALAASFGARGVKVASAAAFDEEFARAVRHRGPTLIEIDMHSLTPINR
ncbi:thiamine pyrophosphate-binding protein [Streptomyces sp. NPDC046821]|uniref:thiamine pyrophosphate-binding protein n=1 Tax=Streptomyces sp. NPDC046821 TaxID=3154702 RepID=UPI0033D493BA